MPFIDSLDIANRALQMCGANPILDVSEDSVNNFEVSAAYDKLRRAELNRSIWGFAVRKAALRPIDNDTMMLAPSLYDATRTYLAGEIVKDTNGLTWVSEIASNLNNTPGGNNDAWDMYFGPNTADQWDSTQSYYAGELVYVRTGTTPNGYQVYMSLISGNTDTPGTATAYDATVQYKQDDVVAYGGNQWRSLVPINLGNTPADGPLAWASGTAYTVGQQVTGSDSYIYTAAGSTTGNDPVTDGGVHWTNTGTINAWSRTPTLTVSSINWRPVTATLKNIMLIYPLGSGPASQSATRNVYRLPAGYLRVAPQDPKIPTSWLGGPSGYGERDWEFSGHYIVSAASDAFVFRFVADVTKVADMHDMFCEGLACRVALAVAPRITQSGAKTDEIAGLYRNFMREARLVNAIEQGYDDPPDDQFLTVRY